MAPDNRDLGHESFPHPVCEPHTQAPDVFTLSQRAHGVQEVWPDGTGRAARSRDGGHAPDAALQGGAALVMVSILQNFGFVSACKCITRPMVALCLHEKRGSPGSTRASRQ